MSSRFLIQYALYDRRYARLALYLIGFLSIFILGSFYAADRVEAAFCANIPGPSECTVGGYCVSCVGGDCPPGQIGCCEGTGTPSGGGGCHCSLPPGECESCNCTASCVAPSGGPNWVAPADGATISNVSGLNVLSWSTPSSWGANTNRSDCEDNECHYQSHNGEKFRLLYNGANISSYCSEHIGTPGSEFLTGTSCTLTQLDPSWYGNNITLGIRAENGGCSGSTTVRTFHVAANEKPYCENITLTGGRVANGLFGAGDTEPITFTVNSGENDPYGPPSFLSICYALRNQPTSFYQNPANYVCYNSGGPDTSFSKHTSYAQLKTDYAGIEPDESVINANGFVIVTNTGDNRNAGEFCSTNIGYNNGTGVYWPYIPTSCDGGSCVVNMYNNPPNITAASPGGTSYIGTEDDADNGPQCVDNNPFSYTMTVQDMDGAADIDILEFALASQANTLNPDPGGVGRSKWELRARFAKEWDGQATNTFYVRDAEVSSGHNCYLANRTVVPRTPENRRCFAPDTHTWENAAQVPGSVTIPAGWSATVYYLTSDIEVYNEGHIARLVGSSNWANASYVAYEVGGTRVYANFRVAFEDDGAQSWDGVYNQLWHVYDIPDTDDDVINVNGATLLTTQNNSYHQYGSSVVDMSTPAVTIGPINVRTASQLDLTWSATDDGPAGISFVYGEGSQLDPDPLNRFPIRDITADSENDPDVPAYLASDQATWYQLNNHSDPVGPYLWNKRNINAATGTRVETIDIGQNESGVMNFAAYATDRACNSEESSTTRDLAKPWLITRGGHVYSSDGINISVRTFADPASPLSPDFTIPPFNFLRREAEVSTEFASSYAVIQASIFVNSATTGVYGLSNYYDQNNSKNYWYPALVNMLSGSILQAPDKFAQITLAGSSLAGKVSSLADADATCASPDINCVVYITNNLTINPDNSNPTNPGAPFICDRRTVFIVPGQLVIDSDIKSGSADTGCIFLARQQVNIQDGKYQSAGNDVDDPPRYDIIEGFIISDGQVSVEEVDLDPNIVVRDGLKVYGSMLAFGGEADPQFNAFSFERSLKLLNNSQYPSIVFQYDNRYLHIGKLFFGIETGAYKNEVGFKPI